MHREDFFVNDGCDGQAIEAVRESFPQFDVIPAFTFVIEAVNPVDTSTFVISTQYEKVFWIFDLVGKEEADGF